MNLVIGNTSQLSKYFPYDYIKLSSRDISEHIFKSEFESAYITFAKQNVFDDNDTDFNEVNFYNTINIIEKLLDNNCKKIVVYTTCEMFNNVGGPIGVDTKPNFKPKNKNYTNYIVSKYNLMQKIIRMREVDSKWNNVIIVHPFNFESKYKNKQFLFGKITDSITNKKIIEIGDTYFYRDITHAKHIVKMSIESKKDIVAGSGKLYFVNDVIRQIYKEVDMDYNYYVKETVFGKTNKPINYADVHTDFDFVKDFVNEFKLQ